MSERHHELVPAEPAVAVGGEPPAPVVYNEIDFTIAADTARRLLEARPENTRRAYDRAWGQFTRWCADAGRVSLPATPQSLADYVARLIGMELAPATIDQALGAIRTRHAENGHPGTPDTRAAILLLRAYRREWADRGNRVRKATPLLLDALRAMVETCGPGAPADLRDRALLLLGFNLMARRSELSGLDLEDLRVEKEGLVAFIRRSKTDQAAEGAQRNVPYGRHADTCAVRATLAWTEALRERGLEGGPLFRPIDRHGRIGGEPGTAGSATVRLTGRSVGDIVKRRAALAGLPENYSGHSLRSGAATSAYAAGVPVSVIAAHGRWAEKSPVVLDYIRAVDQWRNNPMRGVGL
ncbi:site-specific integrase [Spirillospora sp. NPDC050679]